jgi:hypothetical protein
MVPTIAEVTGDMDGSVDLADSFTMGFTTNMSSLGDADSLYFIVYDQSGNNVIKKTSRSTTSVTFTPGEMNALDNGPGFIQVNAFTYDIETVGGSTVAFVAQGSSTKSVTLN